MLNFFRHPHKGEGRIYLAVLLLVSLIAAMVVLSCTPKQPDIVDLKTELNKKYPNSRNIYMVFHGHSVPAGYFVTPHINTFKSYPFLVFQHVKEKSPNANISLVNTAKGGETSDGGLDRFDDVLNHKPDILFIDYGLNDRRITLAKSRRNITRMINRAKSKGAFVVLMTPSPDDRESITDENSPLAQQTNQLQEIAASENVLLVDVFSFFKSKVINGDSLNSFLSTHNHPNEMGHVIIAEQIISHLDGKLY